MFKMSAYSLNIEKETLNNTNYRQVLYTTKESQLVLMNVKPGEDIPLETHQYLSQFIRIESGEGIAIVDNIEYKLSDGVAIIIPSGSSHRIINTTNKDLKLYTVYSGTKFEHPEGLIQINQPIPTDRFLTGINEIDFNILNNLSDEDLIKICQVNKDANTLCDDQTFWFDRIKSIFPYIPDNVLNRYKKSSWSDYYIELVKAEKIIYQTLETRNYSHIIQDFARIIKTNRLDLLMIGTEYGYYDWFKYDYSILNASDTARNKGWTEMYEYLESNYVIPSGVRRLPRVPEIPVVAFF
jgi:mannose-6-phosphate isomerase-like protein (cupin superfamily)